MDGQGLWPHEDIYKITRKICQLAIRYCYSFRKNKSIEVAKNESPDVLEIHTEMLEKMEYLTRP